MHKSSLINDFFDLLFPRTCAGCDQPLAVGEEFICSVCEHSLPYLTNQEEVKNKFANRLPLEEVGVLLKFNTGGVVQQLLHEIKYRQNPDLAVFLGRLIGVQFKEALTAANLDMIIPVPLHHSKQRSRGYNQSERIAHGIAEVLDIDVNDKLLSRTLKSETQTRKNRGERWNNVANIFAIRDEKPLLGKNILLVDDVITTGATLESCGVSLLTADINQLSIVALADA